MLSKRGIRVLPVFLILAAALFLGAGCVKDAGQWVLQTAKNAGKPTFTPLKLVYSLKNFGTDKEMIATVWLEGKQVCQKREAYAGLLKITDSQNSAAGTTAKITIYADNGEVVMSKFINRDDNLVFDDFTSQYNDLPILLPLNSIFSFAGKNFNSSEVWQNNSPLILKQVDSGLSLSDYSVTRQGEEKNGVAPCQKFKIVAKGSDMNGILFACLAKGINKIKLPFVVSFSFDDIKNGPTWQLKSFSSELSGLTWTPQCLALIKCHRAERLSEPERRLCEAQGGSEEAVKNDFGCVGQYKCQSQSEAADQAITSQQRENCPVDKNLRAEVIQCGKNNQPNFDVVKYNNSGCAAEITCRQ